MVGADHELCRDESPIRAGSQVDGGALQVGQRPGHGFQLAVDRPLAASETEERLRLTRGLPGGGSCALVIGSSIPRGSAVSPAAVMGRFPGSPSRAGRRSQQPPPTSK